MMTPMIASKATLAAIAMAMVSESSEDESDGGSVDDAGVDEATKGWLAPDVAIVLVDVVENEYSTVESCRVIQLWRIRV